MFVSRKWKERAYEENRKVQDLQEEILKLRDRIAVLEDVHRYLEGSPLGKKILDLKAERMEQNLSANILYLPVKDIPEFAELTEGSLRIVPNFHRAYFDKLFGLEVKYTSKEMRIE